MDCAVVTKEVIIKEKRGCSQEVDNLTDDDDYVEAEAAAAGGRHRWSDMHIMLFLSVFLFFFLDYYPFYWSLSNYERNNEEYVNVVLGL